MADDNNSKLQWMFCAQYLSPLVSSATTMRLKCQAVASPVPLCQMCSSCSWPMWRNRKSNPSVEPREKASALVLASCWRPLLDRFPAWTNGWLRCPLLLAFVNCVQIDNCRSWRSSTLFERQWGGGGLKIPESVVDGRPRNGCAR